ncbi:microprocessor complex subunit DGCR8 [Hyposmocoma kahamanoa]|uniref:microprocessor complex subunit DGCR8 n=1 Tax=Hyposmocoma kahamanoa TaxID=1477025 RepID=UPI000E6DA4EC|nr:microprocessor complex subunit DGCR8 [Hyposmocoma kahamanoa]
MEEPKEPASKKRKLSENSQETVAVEEFTKDCESQIMEMDNAKFEFEEKYDNFISQEELEKLREFQVLDEVKSNDEDSNDEESESSDDKSEGVPEEEIEKMLDEDLPEELKAAPKPKEKPYVTRHKVVLEEKGINHFEVLPLDWMIVRHYSGMPVYMHRTTRVCTLSKPYFLGKGNTRRHDIPISAIPCLAYRKALEEEAKQKEIDKQIEEQIRNGTWRQFHPQTQNENNKKTDVSSENQVIKCPFKHGVPNGNSKNESSVIKETNISNDQEMSESRETSAIEKTKTIENQSDIQTSDNMERSNLPNSQGVNLVNVDQPMENGECSQSSGEMNQNRGEINQNSGETNQNSGETNQNSELATENEVEITELNIVEEVPLNRQPVILPGGIVMPPPRVETVSTSWKTQHLTHEQVNDYCKKLFQFKTVNIMHFKRWADRRKYTKARKTLQYPTLPEGTKLITIPAQSTAGQENGGGKANKRDWVMNMNGRSYLSVFHEYVRRALQKQPVYEFKQLENASTPYQATVYIGGMQYGVGHGSSKRAAKSAAARASIHILIPEMRHELDTQPGANANNEPDFSFFDYVGIEDPRITEFCAAACEPSPHAILRTCLLRNFGATDRHIHTEMKKLEYQKIELTMKVGKHTATVVCKNKKTAKQRASQAILQALHPHVRSWGSLLRLYGSRSVKSCKEKKLEEQQITLLQDAARHNEPNYAVLDKLRHEMRKLRERDQAVVAIGTLLVRADLPQHSGSNLCNVQL